MNDAQLDKLLRDALLEASIQDSAELDEAVWTPSWSYLRKKKRMLRDPFSYGARVLKSPWQIALQRAAVIFLAVLALFGSLMMVPQVRAETARVFRAWFATYTEFSLTGSGVEHADYYPSYLPDGFTESRTISSAGNLTVVFSRGEESLIFNVIQNREGTAALINTEDCREQKLSVCGLPAALYISSREDYPSYLVWSSGDENILFILTAELPEAELLKIAESVEKGDAMQ